MTRLLDYTSYSCSLFFSHVLFSPPQINDEKSRHLWLSTPNKSPPQRVGRGERVAKMQLTLWFGLVRTPKAGDTLRWNIKSWAWCLAQLVARLMFVMPDQDYNLITSAAKEIYRDRVRQKEGERNRGKDQCKHQRVLSPYISGQIDKVLKRNKCGLTATSKSSARGLLLLKAQECCC